MHHHRRHVLGLRVDIGRHIDTQLGQHALDALHGKGRLGDLVTTAIQADYQAVAHQLVAPDAGNLRNILDPLCERERRQ